MPFLNKKEQSLINVVNANTDLLPDQRKTVITEIKCNARLREEQYRPAVKVFLSVLSSFRTNQLITNTLK